MPKKKKNAVGSGTNGHSTWQKLKLVDYTWSGKMIAWIKAVKLEFP